MAPWKCRFFCVWLLQWVRHGVRWCREPKTQEVDDVAVTETVTQEFAEKLEEARRRGVYQGREIELQAVVHGAINDGEPVPLFALHSWLRVRLELAGRAEESVALEWSYSPKTAALLGAAVGAEHAAEMDWFEGNPVMTWDDLQALEGMLQL